MSGLWLSNGRGQQTHAQEMDPLPGRANRMWHHLWVSGANTWQFPPRKGDFSKNLPRSGVWEWSCGINRGRLCFYLRSWCGGAAGRRSGSLFSVWGFSPTEGPPLLSQLMYFDGRPWTGPRKWLLHDLALYYLYPLYPIWIMTRGRCSYTPDPLSLWISGKKGSYQTRNKRF